MIPLDIINDYSSSLLYNHEKISKLIDYIFNNENCNNGLVSIILTKREYLSNLKKKYFKVNQYTDVIAFNLENHGEDIEGEIYISIDDILENSKKYNVSFNNEFNRVVIHGILHLLGYDDQNDKEKKIMRSLEDKYLLNCHKNIIKLNE